jgi:hypothetical protein
MHADSDTDVTDLQWILPGRMGCFIDLRGYRDGLYVPSHSSPSVA